MNDLRRLDINSVISQLEDARDSETQRVRDLELRAIRAEAALRRKPTDKETLALEHLHRIFRAESTDHLYALIEEAEEALS